MATSVIRCSVVSSSAGRRNLCDSLAEHGQLASVEKSKSVTHLDAVNSDSSIENSCACLGCQCKVNDTVNFKANDTWPVEHKHQPLNVGSLGTLSAKESPLLARRQQQQQEKVQQLIVESSPHYSLRSATPSYAERKPQIDLSAVEALQQTADMPAVRTMDINRNNGYLYNGTIMSPSSEKREHLYKILVIGELGTGKTSFIKRYVHQFFSQNYRATIGVDFALKVLHWDANTIVRLQLWDIAGQERFGNMTRVYYKEAVGAFIVFDVTRSGTFDCVSKWKEDLDSKVQLPDGSPIPCILLANKCDQEKQGIVTQPERMDEYVRENGFAGWFETSAKENINIDEAARALVNKILINDKLIAADANDEEKFNLSTAGEAGAEAKNKCSC
ncbi:ras-related protein Rab-32 isoform X2 [Drosophila sulfurigaster albostrigata]|uniref:ras-related protein Rab-32 isoform X2 n=1 Tax=Drosophila sulfurigaster albostrigata TaxID=89887 RepID=UPI002D219C10|nr:ras-related protein Rab-32 isoform X2 [Drosophila sulfurigaster albostrigata]